MPCCRLFPAAGEGCLSWKAPENPLSCQQRCTQHNTKNTAQRERSTSAVRTLQVHLTRFGSEDLIFGETGHQAPAGGSCVRQTDGESPCNPPEGTFPLGLLHIHGLGRTQAAPVYSAGNARACIPTVSQDWCSPRDGEHWLKLASHFPSYLSSSSRRDPRAAPLQAFPKSPQHFQSGLQPGSWDTKHRFRGNGRGDPSRASRGCMEVMAPMWEQMVKFGI